MSKSVSTFHHHNYSEILFFFSPPFLPELRPLRRLNRNYFSQQCKPIINNSVLPILGSLTNKRIDNITIENDDIISLIRKLNPDKATGSDGISGQMLLLCDESIILPLQIIFTNLKRNAPFGRFSYFVAKL